MLQTTPYYISFAPSKHDFVLYVHKVYNYNGIHDKAIPLYELYLYSPYNNYYESLVRNAYTNVSKTFSFLLQGFYLYAL